MYWRACIVSDCGINLLFSWKLVETHADRDQLDANVTNDVKPELTMEAVALPAGRQIVWRCVGERILNQITVIAKDADGALDKVNDAFIHVLMQKGVYQGTKYVVDSILSTSKS